MSDFESYLNTLRDKVKSVSDTINQDSSEESEDIGMPLPKPVGYSDYQLNQLMYHRALAKKKQGFYDGDKTFEEIMKMDRDECLGHTIEHFDLGWEYLTEDDRMNTLRVFAFILAERDPVLSERGGEIYERLVETHRTIPKFARHVQYENGEIIDIVGLQICKTVDNNLCVRLTRLKSTEVEPKKAAIDSCESSIFSVLENLSPKDFETV
jgi:hypothetical protein